MPPSSSEIAPEKSLESGAPFFFFANQPALDLANTLAAVKDGPLDLLADLDSLCRWLVAAGLATTGEVDALRASHPDPAASVLLAAVRAYRAEIKGAVAALDEGGPVPSRFVEETNRLLREAGAVLQVGAGGDRTYRRDFPTAWPRLEAVLGRIAQIGAALLCDCDLSLVRRCENPRCVMVFYDTTKNHQRRWCSMEICGNRHKAALHRQKRKTQPEA